uniref:(northern house mosquito) hypothetical protein n=1 Tax=Culex pipiens TaxID=7175 RepID=A0A8D8HJQ9_CULPI
MNSSHWHPVRHRSWISIFPRIVTGPRNPAGSNCDITMLSTIRFVGHVSPLSTFAYSDFVIVVKLKTSSTGSQTIPSTRSYSGPLSRLKSTVKSTLFSPNAFRTAAELDTQFLMLNPPRECTSFTSLAR